MTSYLAPESPRPYSIAAEQYFQRLNFATGLPVPDRERIYPISKCRFGAQYEKELCTYLAKHADVNCGDRVCLVGDEPEWTTIVQERLCLIKPVHFVDCKLDQGEWKDKSTAQPARHSAENWSGTAVRIRSFLCFVLVLLVLHNVIDEDNIECCDDDNCDMHVDTLEGSILIEQMKRKQSTVDGCAARQRRVRIL